MAPTSSTQALKLATGIEKKPQSPQDVISGMIKAELPRIQRLLQNPGMTKRFAQLAMMEMRRTPKLLECYPESVLAGLLTSASLGLQLGVGGQCFLVPYGREATFVTGWKGYVTLMNRTERAQVWTGAVREGDEFDYSDGSRPFIHHKRKADRDAQLTHFWSNGQQNGAEYPTIDVWTLRDAERHRTSFNKVGPKHYSFNNPESFEAYGRKLPLLQVVKYMPSSYEIDQAQELDFTADAGTQKLRPNDVIEGIVGAELPPLTPSELTPYDQAFDILEWDSAQRKAFLDEHKGKSEEDIKSLLNVEVDRLP